MAEIDVLLEGLHEHEDQILLGILLCLEELDELVMLEENVQPYQVDLFQVWVGDSVIDEMPWNKCYKLWVKDAFLIRGFAFGDQRLQLIHFVLLDEAALLSSNSEIIILALNIWRGGNWHPWLNHKLALSLDHSEHFKWNLDDMVRQHVHQIRERLINIIDELQEPDRVSNHHVPG